jgi:nitrogen regulatory protein PII
MTPQTPAAVQLADAGGLRSRGDGIIVVSEVVDVVRIRTGETGAPAL